MGSNLCTAPDKNCTNPTTRHGVRDIYNGRLCNTCWTRIRNRHTVECSEPSCKGRILKDQTKATEYKGRTKPQPWCRRHEHLALSAETIGEASRNRILSGYFKHITPAWESGFGCWIWTGPINNAKSNGKPYGKFWRKIIGSWSAHRLAFHLFYTGRGYSHVVDHRCGNRLCVNPLHLQAVPQRINDQRQGKRNDRDGIIQHWSYQEEADPITEELEEFARTNLLPLRTPNGDYSKPWEPVTLEQARKHIVELLNARPLTDLEPLLQELSKYGLKPNIISDLNLNPEEAEYLLKIKAKPRRRIKRRRRSPLVRGSASKP